MSVAVEGLHRSANMDLEPQTHPFNETEVKREPLGQSVQLTARRTNLHNYFTFVEHLTNPPDVAYDRLEKEKIEKNAVPYHEGFMHFRHNGADFYHGTTRSLGAGQLTMTSDGRFVLIGKSPDYDPHKIIGFDLIAGASQQTGDINFRNTAAREGSVEELVEIRNGKIVVPYGDKEHTIIKGRENIRQFLEEYKGTLPEPFDSTFNRILEDTNGAGFVEEPYQTHPKMEDLLRNVPKGSISIERSGKIIHTTEGKIVIHKKGGDILFPRIVDPKNIIDLEIVTNPDNTQMLLNRTFLLATRDQYLALCNGESVELEMTRLGDHWFQEIQVDPKPLAEETGRYLASPTY